MNPKPDSVTEEVEDSRALTSPEVVAQFQAGLTQIAASLVSLRDGFSSIQDGLDSVGALDLLREWKQLKENYNTIDGDFRARSTSVFTFLEKVETGVLSQASSFVKDTIDTESKDEALDEIDFLTPESAKTGKATEQLVQNFNTLKDKLVRFQTVFEKYAAAQRKTQHEKISVKSAKVKDLEKQRNALVSQIKEKTLAGQEERFEHFGWVWRLPGLNSIIVILSLLRDLTVKQQVEDLKKRYEDLTEDILRAKTELSGMQVDSDALGSLSIKISLQTDNRLEDVSGGVNIFNDVWKSGDQDLKEVDAYLKDPTTSVPLTLTIYGHTRKSVYNGIKSALKNFSTA